MKCAALILLMTFTLGKQVIASTVEWNAGTVVLNDDQVLNGIISVKAKHDLVLLKIGDRVNVLPAHRIKSVYFYDRQNNVNRKFVAISPRNALRQHRQLYETVLTGDVSVLRKLKMNAGELGSDADDFDYYILHHEEVTSLNRFRSAIFPALVDAKGNLLTDYMKAKRLNPNIDADVLLIAEHYNQLVEEETAMAKDEAFR
jgi:hypothetical protein